jgi:hypothetical protein
MAHRAAPRRARAARLWPVPQPMARRGPSAAAAGPRGADAWHAAVGISFAAGGRALCGGRRPPATPRAGRGAQPVQALRARRQTLPHSQHEFESLFPAHSLPLSPAPPPRVEGAACQNPVSAHSRFLSLSPLSLLPHLGHDRGPARLLGAPAAAGAPPHAAALPPESAATAPARLHSTPQHHAPCHEIWIGCQHSMFPDPPSPAPWRSPR